MSCWGLAVVCTAAFSLVEIGYTESPMGRPIIFYAVDSEEQIKEEIRNGEKEELAQLVQAEAGNQSLEGKRLVADVVLNRVQSPDYPDTIHDVIFQKGQFKVTETSAFNNAGWHMQDSDYEAVELEMESGEQLDYDVLYFSRGKGAYGYDWYKVGDHWFGSGTR